MLNVDVTGRNSDKYCSLLQLLIIVVYIYIQLTGTLPRTAIFFFETTSLVVMNFPSTWTIRRRRDKRKVRT